MESDQNPVKAYLVDRQFAALEAHLDQLITAYRNAPDSAAQDTLDRAFSIFGDGDNSDTLLEAIDHWRAGMPDSALAILASGLVHQGVAMAARGCATVDQVSSEQWRAVERHFKEAEQYLRHALDDNRFALPTGIILDALITREQISGSRTRAEKLFEQMLERDPYWLNGWQHIQGVREPRWGGSWQDMDALLDLARQTLPERAVRDLTATHWWWRGSYAYGFEEDARSALEYLDKALPFAERPRQRAQIQEYRAYALTDLERVDEALAAWRMAVTDDPCAEYCCRYGWALESAGKMPEAIAAMEQGARLDGEYAATCAIWLGAMFYNGDDGNRPELIDHKQAISWLERALVVGKGDDYSNAANKLGLLYFESDSECDLVKAEQVLRMAVDSGNAYGAYNLARLLDGQGKNTEAFTFYRLAATRGHEESIRIVGSRIEEMPDDDAETWLQAAVERHEVSAHIALARRRLRQGRVDEAEILLWQGAAHPAGTKIVCVLGRALLEGRLGGASDLERAYQLFSTACDSKDFDTDVYADFFLTFLVATHEKFCRVSWLEYRGIRKSFSAVRKRFKKQPYLASDAQRRELILLMKQLSGNRFSWRMRKWLGKLPVLARTAPFSDL